MKRGYREIKRIERKGNSGGNESGENEDSAIRGDQRRRLHNEGVQTVTRTKTMTRARTKTTRTRERDGGERRRRNRETKRLRVEQEEGKRDPITFCSRLRSYYRRAYIQVARRRSVRGKGVLATCETLKSTTVAVNTSGETRKP